MACQVKYSWNGCILQDSPIGALKRINSCKTFSEITSLEKKQKIYKMTLGDHGEILTVLHTIAGSKCLAHNLQCLFNWSDVFASRSALRQFSTQIRHLKRHTNKLYVTAEKWYCTEMVDIYALTLINVAWSNRTPKHSDTQNFPIAKQAVTQFLLKGNNKTCCSHTHV